jgi:hypothetical protein
VMPLTFNGAITGLAPTYTRHTLTAVFEIKVENGAPPEDITFSNFVFEITATPVPETPALSGPARALVALLLVGSATAGVAIDQRRRLLA